MDLLIRFLEKTAWKMTPPEPYGTFHLVFWLTGLPIAFPAAFFLRKVSDKTDRRLLFSVGFVLLLAEAYKQLFYTFIVGGGEYQFDRIPFQLCSMPMYACLVLPFLREGKFRRALCTFTASFGFMGGFVSYFSPESMCLPYWTLTIHSFSWHMILVFIGLYLFFSGRAGARFRDFLPAAGIYLFLCLVAFGINALCYNCPGADVNMFYVGPKPSPLVICRDIVARFGWAVNTVVYVTALTLCAFAFYSAYLLLRKAVRKHAEKRIRKKA